MSTKPRGKKISEPASRNSRYRHAVALDYAGAADEVPSIGAAGDDLIADEIVRLARRFGVPIVEQGALAEALSRLEPDERIPAELYEPVAVLLHTLDQKARGKK